MRKYSYQKLDSFTDATVEAASSLFDKSQPTIRRLSKNRILAILFICALCIITWGLLAFHPSYTSAEITTPAFEEPLSEQLPSTEQLPPSFEVQRRPTGRIPHIDEDALKLAIQETYERKGFPNVGCKLLPWHEARYAALKYSAHSHSSASKLQTNATTIFIAMNLYNSAGLFNVLVEQLPETIRFLGVQNVHVSIYENGSDDDTGAVLILLARALDAIGGSYTIISKGKTEVLNKGFPHRIEVLAGLRNKALAPLFDARLASSMPGGKFDEVLFINDIYWCTADLLEVLYQRRRRGAYQSCAVDWDWNMRIVYDRWVLRTIEGRTWYDTKDLIEYWLHDHRPLDEKPWPVPLKHNLEHQSRFLGLRPLQVFACWNGMTVFDASVFVQHGIRFRIGRSDKDKDTGAIKQPTDIVSECYLTSVDMWSAGIGKIVLAPRARVAYDLNNYNFYRKDREIGQIDDLPALDASEDFKWILEPPKEVAMQDFASWENEDQPERWAPWNEP